MYAWQRDVSIPRYNFEKLFVEGAGPFGLWVTTDVFNFGSLFASAVSAELSVLPNQLEIVYSDLSPVEFFSLPKKAQRFYRIVELFLNTFPYSVLRVKNGEQPCVPIKHISSWGRKSGRRPLPFLKYLPYAYSTPALIAKGTSYPAERTAHIINVPCWPNLTLGRRGTRNFTDFFSRIKMYICLFKYDIDDKKLRLNLYNTVLDYPSHYPRARVVDHFFYLNKPCTNRSKLSRVIRWYHFLQPLLSLPDSPHLSPLDLQAYKATKIFNILIHEEFRPWHFTLFSEHSENKSTTDELYFSAITDINNAMLQYELTSLKLTAPTALTSKQVKHKQNTEDNKSQKASIIPLNIFLRFVAKLYHSKDKKKHLFALLCLINFLSVSRFSELLSFHMSQLKFKERHLESGKVRRYLPIKLYRSKVGKQEYELPVIPYWPLLNLEFLLQKLTPFLQKKHKDLRDLNLKPFKKLSNAAFNKAIDKYWNEFLKQTSLSFDPMGTHFKSHTLRKLSADFYIDLLGLNKNYVRILYGHKETSRTLESVYMRKSRFQLTQEAYWHI